mmetsp:Transcript_72680/g.224792  ORF Transcript_72680/g.224792 Transcript_72680/m.224792 type:complete len:247 (-) Transcript_72680:866-1606(-)
MSSSLMPMRMRRRPLVSSSMVTEPSPLMSTSSKNVDKSSASCDSERMAMTVAAWNSRQLNLPLWSSSTRRRTPSAKRLANSGLNPMMRKVLSTSAKLTLPVLSASQIAKMFQISRFWAWLRPSNSFEAWVTDSRMCSALLGWSWDALRPRPAKRTSTKKSRNRPMLPSCEIALMAFPHFLPSMEFRTVKRRRTFGTTLKSMTGHSSHVSAHRVSCMGFSGMPVSELTMMAVAEMACRKPRERSPCS